MARRELNSTDEQDLDKRTFLYMSVFAIFFINGPLMVLNLIANIFFGFCLMTRKTQQVKQPLMILLGSMVSCTILYVLSVTLLACVLEWVESIVVAVIAFQIVTLLMHVNMNTYVWLMFYYYTMIVPSQRALFLWLKKNIKSFIYVMMLLDSLIFLGNASFEITLNIIDYSIFNNGTELVFIDIGFVLDSIVYIHLFLCLLVMMISCFATAHYLNKHMKSLSASDGSLSNPRLHSQIRVTVTGILQGVLCFICTICDLVDGMSLYLSPFYFDAYIPITVINLYIFGTTVNLGVGQTLFRERAVHVWKAVKKRLCTGK